MKEIGAKPLLDADNEWKKLTGIHTVAETGSYDQEQQ